jgi:alkanesulfonate monooxygenase SsuD/methylene tetrahydromethanopterin reductase-like flavin-dependent oxidoreductase (luciferase family)
MTDYGHPVSFGVSLIPSVGLTEENRRLARLADEAGLDYVAIQDHAYNHDFLDVWTLITYLAAETRRISFFPDVADLQLRPPTLLAKSAASLSVLTGGRIVLGVGGGATARGIAGMGAQARTGSDMIAFTDEAIQIMRKAFAGGNVVFSGLQNQVEGYHAGPLPAAPVPIWLGSSGPKMFALTGRQSDGWVSPLNTYMPPENVGAAQRVIDEAARGAARPEADVRRIYNVVGAIGDSGGAGFTAGVEAWIEALTDWTVGLGFDTFIFWPTGPAASQLETFARKVAPAVRERVADRRGTE